ncbi:MAG: S24 family peptidase [Candidatus Paceibacterota bacterium]|jgi:repressor LexA
MHPIQEKILKLSSSKNLGQMTLREIGELVGEKFPQKIKHHLTQLERKGLVKINKATSTIERTMGGMIKNTTLISIPIIGTANCGPATIFAEENVQGYLKVSVNLLAKKKGVFAIRASGLSMNRADIRGKSIEDGDYVIVDSEDRVASTGDVILSVIDGMANIKKYVWDTENGQVILVSESTKDLPPIYLSEGDDFIVNGKVVQVIKKPKI